MLKRIVPLPAVCLMAFTLYAANAGFVGEWKLDPSRTKLTDQFKVENVSGNRYAFDFGPGAETITVDGTEQTGVSGTTLSVAVEGPHSWKVVRRKNGRTLLTAIWNLSSDGNTLTDDFTFFDPKGSGSTVHYVYKRTSGTSGFAGTWESTSATVTDTYVVTIRPWEKDGLTFVDPSQGITRNVHLNGQEYPSAGPNLPQGLVSSARQLDESTLEMADKFKGKTLDTQEIRLSSDRRTLTITMRTPGQREPNIFVFARL